MLRLTTIRSMLVIAILTTTVVAGCSSPAEPATEGAPSETPTPTIAPTSTPIPVPIETDPPTGKPFKVKITFQPTQSATGLVTLTATSNLPDGADLMASMYSDAGYHAQDSALLTDGVAVFGPFSDDGAGLPDGNYDLSISMSIASLQTAAVRKYIGEDGELMTGPLVVGNSVVDGYHVSLDTILSVK